MVRTKSKVKNSFGSGPSSWTPGQASGPSSDGSGSSRPGRSRRPGSRDRIQAERSRGDKFENLTEIFPLKCFSLIMGSGSPSWGVTPITY